jgi:DNA polymerase-3 subunit beta
MKIRISKKVLDLELSKVSKPVTSNNVLPSLSGILFEVDTDKIILTGSDGVTTIKSEIFKLDDILEIEKVGSVILPIKYIIEIVKKIDSKNITIELLEDNVCKIYDDISKFTISTIDAEQYPNFDFEIQSEKINIPLDVFIEIDKEVSFAVSQNDNRPILKGINLNSNGNLVATATDSFRLARKVIDKIYDNFNITVQKKIISDICKIAAGSETIDIYINERTLLFMFDNIKILTRIIDGQYPDVNKLIPQEFSREVTIDRIKLIKAIERVTLISSAAKSIVKFEINNNEFVISSSAGDLGNGTEKLTEFELVGDQIQLSLNSQYLINALRTFDTENIILKITSDVKPLIITKLNSYDLVQLILPIRTY